MFGAQRIPSDLCERLFAAIDPAYLCDGNCVLEFSGHLDFERLSNAFLAALADEPMWSHRFVPAYWRPYWLPIPTRERRDLVQLVATEGSGAALEQILCRTVDAAARLFVLRGPNSDTLCLRADHRLADGAAVRLLVDAIAAHYAAGTPEPLRDAPLVRRTTKLLRSVVSRSQRRKNFQLAGEQVRVMQRAPVAFGMPPVAPEDPIGIPQRLHYADGTVDALRARAMQDRGTPTLAIAAATYLSLRDVCGIASQAPVYLGLAVDLRRYLPAEQQPAPASMFLGRAFVPVNEPGATSMSAVMEQLRVGLAKQRGPQFGLIQSTITLDIPLIRALINLWPFAWLQAAALRRQLRNKSTPDVAVSDLGEFGRPGDRWGDAVLQNAFGIPGTVPHIIVCSGTCGSRLNVTVSAGPRSFTQKLTAAMHVRLSDYLGLTAPARA